MINREHTNDDFGVLSGFIGGDVMNVSRDVLMVRACLHEMDLWPEYSIRPVVLGRLLGIMFGFPTTEARIVAQMLLLHWVGYDVLDLSGGLVNILLPIGLVFHLSLLPGTSLLHWLYLLSWLKLALVIVVGRLIIRYKLVLPFSNESLLHQGLEIWEIEHVESTPELRV